MQVFTEDDCELCNSKWAHCATGPHKLAGTPSNVNKCFIIWWMKPHQAQVSRMYAVFTDCPCDVGERTALAPPRSVCKNIASDMSEFIHHTIKTDIVVKNINCNNTGSRYDFYVKHNQNMSISIGSRFLWTTELWPRIQFLYLSQLRF